MKEIKYTPQGFSYVDVGIFEVINWAGIGICNSCGEGPFRNLKLVWVLGDTYCEKCFNEWLERAKHYSKNDIAEDLTLQKGNDIRWYKAHLGDVKCDN